MSRGGGGVGKYNASFLETIIGDWVTDPLYL